VKPAGFDDRQTDGHSGHKVSSMSSVCPQGHHQLRWHLYQKQCQTMPPT